MASWSNKEHWSSNKSQDRPKWATIETAKTLNGQKNGIFFAIMEHLRAPLVHFEQS